MTDSRIQPNWLFRGLIIFSLLVHGVLFVHLAGLYRPRSLTYLELTMRSVAKPVAREIPRPRIRPPARTPSREIPLAEEQPLRAPIKPLETPRLESEPDIFRESVALPQPPVVKDLNVSQWTPAEPANTPAAAPSIVEPEITEEDYRIVIRKKITNHLGNKYNSSRAKRRNQEGRVKISIAIGVDGKILDLKIVQSSGHRILDRFVIKEVKASEPFSSPPDGPVTVIIPIQFRLI